jgi:hypothetical protein
MLVTDFKTIIRPNPAIPFFMETELFNKHEGAETVRKLRESKKMVYEYTISDDKLTFNSVAKFDSLETYSACETAAGINADFLYYSYRKSVGIPQFSDRSTAVIPYYQTGIDSPFTCTTSYTFQDNDLYKSTFKNIMENWKNSEHRVSVIEDANTVTIVYRYNNSEDFSKNYFGDMNLVPTLYEHKVTRTICYKLLDN